MGRKKMYFTAKEKREAQRKWQMDYYYRNKDTILKKMKENNWVLINIIAN